MSLSSVAYARFFTPQTISLLFCLNEVTKIHNQEQINPNNKLIVFLIDKILKVPQSSSNAMTNQDFQAQLLSVVQQEHVFTFLSKYQVQIAKIQSFNDFYRQVSNILKHLRTLRSNKLQQGNLVDFLIRRMYIYFEKLDFKEIVQIYNNFIKYRENQKPQIPHKQHEFMITKSIQQVKFNLQNYKTVNPQQIGKLIDQLQQSDHTFKTSYLKGLLNAQQKIPISSINSMHRYFDKSLGNLFQQKLDGPGTTNKINHCILSMAYGALQMGQLDQCLQCISEGLRISQNNSDQQSINNCIIYLYKIAQQLGKYKQQILLAQHAITHSLNLTNLILMLYSCLNYSYFQKYYDCQEPALMILKSRHISWTEALHFSKKKIYSSFQNNCKNIYHYHRNLLIPTFMCKLSILLHLPQLKQLLINPYYQRSQLTQLQIYKEYQDDKEINRILETANLYLKTSQKHLFQQTLFELNQFRKKSNLPVDIIKVNLFLSKYKIQNKMLMAGYKQGEQNLKFCKDNGFVKYQYIHQLNIMNKILIDSKLYYDALIKIDYTLRLSEKYFLDSQTAWSSILKAEAYIYIGSLNTALQILQQIQQSGKIFNSDKNNTDLQVQFYRTKKLANRSLLNLLNKQQFPQQCEALLKNQIQIMQKELSLNIENVNLIKVSQSLKQIRQFVKENSILEIRQNRQKRVIQTLFYVQKILKIFSQNRKKTSNDALLIKKVGIKVRALYFR